MNHDISIIGLGKLGLPLAVTFASNGFRVYGVDKNASVIRNIKNLKISVFEHNLKNYFKKYKKNIYLSTETISAVLNTSISFVIVPTPSRRDGSFSLEYILNSCKDIGSALKKKEKKHVIVITSTVSPYSMRVIAKKLEDVSGKKMGKDFGLCYSPEFVSLGNTINNFTAPDFILIGESDKKSGDVVEQIRLKICNKKPIVKRTNFINAEIAKIALNTYVTTKISFGNMIARMSENTQGANVDEITDILGSDLRIGESYLKGGIAYGGPCFPRDNKALSHFITSLGLDAAIPNTIDRFNSNQNKYIYNFITKKWKKDVVIGILGLTYKPDTEVIDESPGVYLANKLSKNNVNVYVYDPSVKTIPAVLDAKVKVTQSMNECINKSDVVIIMTPWSEFKKILLTQFRNNKYLVDCWRLFKNISSKGINYIALGIHNS